MNAVVDIKKGLEGVVVDSTSISLVDGDAGRLYYRGIPIERLVKYPVCRGRAPRGVRRAAGRSAAAGVRRFLVERRPVAAGTRRHHRETRATARPSHGDPAGRDALNGASGRPREVFGRTEDEQEALLVAARLPTAHAMLLALRAGRSPAEYPETRRYGERFLQLVQNRRPSDKEIRILEQTQILQIDHSFNASTFTARVVTSTLAPPASALAAAMGSLYGPLHGAADQGALEMAQEVADPKRAADFVAECLSKGRLVMGMGHREYRVVDPRSRIVKTLAEEIASKPEEKRLIETLKAVDEAFVAQTAHKKRSLRANLEFYKGVVYLALGLPKEFFTATFAAARIFGWSAHIVEQRKDNRIVRPSANYIGPAPQPD